MVPRLWIRLVAAMAVIGAFRNSMLLDKYPGPSRAEFDMRDAGAWIGFRCGMLVMSVLKSVVLVSYDATVRR